LAESNKQIDGDLGLPNQVKRMLVIKEKIESEEDEQRSQEGEREKERNERSRWDNLKGARRGIRGLILK